MEGNHFSLSVNSIKRIFTMAIPKWAKITIGIGGYLVLAVLLVVLGAYWIVELGGYIERNPKKMIAHLERTFVIDFPEEIKEVKAAKTPVSWDGAVGFMVKFTADPNAVDRFLKSFRQNIELHRFNPELDTRGTAVIPEPGWFAEPIRYGKEASPILVSRDYGKASSHLSVYIDTTNQESFVVYIHGGYGSELDY